MTPESLFLLIQPLIFLTMVLVAGRWSPARRAQEVRAAKLIAENPNADRCEEVVALQSTWASGKQDEIDRRIQVMKHDGWTYLKMSEVSPWISLRTWGGAVRLHFLRAPMVANNGEQR
ncbi:MAG: hypothetical protein U0941_14535 [Planctomycetaceae bacterium]